MGAEIRKTKATDRIMRLIAEKADESQISEVVEKYQQQERAKVGEPVLLDWNFNNKRLDKATHEVSKLLYLGRDTEKGMRFLNCLLANMVANIHTGLPSPTAVSTKHALYGNRFSVEMQRNILDGMVSAGLIHKQKHSQENGMAASYKPMLRLNKIINDNYDDRSRFHWQKSKVNELTINRRDVEDKNSPDDVAVMSARKYPEATKLRSELKEINENIQSQPFELLVRTALPKEITSVARDGYIVRDNILAYAHEPELYKEGDGFSYKATPNTTLKRAFNLYKGEVLGGRHFGTGSGHYLGLKRQKRKEDVLWNGHRMVEIDANGAHMAIEYALNGLKAPTNPYIYDKGDSFKRDVMKKLGLVTLNKIGTNYKDATKGGLIGDILDGNLDLNALFWFEHRYKQLKSEFIKHNEEIAHVFGMGRVYKLMSVESEIMNRTMLALNQMDIPYLPVFDAMKTLENEAKTVSEVLESTSKAVLGTPLTYSV